MKIPVGDAIAVIREALYRWNDRKDQDGHISVTLPTGSVEVLKMIRLGRASNQYGTDYSVVLRVTVPKETGSNQENAEKGHR